MKRSAIILFSLILLQTVSGQKTETFYDYNWKPCSVDAARFYSTIEKTDSGWFRNDYFINGMILQMRALYEDKDCKVQHGYCSYYYANGRLQISGRRNHGKREGVCVLYYSDGMMADSATFHDGTPVGSRFRWHRNGYLSDTTGHLNDSIDVQVSWFDNGAPFSGGRFLYGKLHGIWKFYHRNGKIAGEEIYDKGFVVSKTYYNEDGSLQPDTAKANVDAVFKKGGNEGWLKYLYKNIITPPGYEIVNTNQVTVRIDFTINEEGKAEDVEVGIPFNAIYDKRALEVIKSSPQWKPALAHNIRVRTLFRQPVTFQQQE